MAILPNMALKARQSFCLRGLRNGETLPSFFLTEVSPDSNTFLSVTTYVY